MAKRWCYPSQRGFTLTELAIVLGILGVILGVIWVAASAVNTNLKAEKASKQILAIVAGTSATFNQHFIPNNIISPLLINNGVVPAEMISACSSGGNLGPAYGGNAGCAYTPWGVQLGMASQEQWGGASASVNMYEIEIAFLTLGQCTSFLPAFVATATGSGLVWVFTTATGGVAVNGNTPLSTFAACSGVIVLQFSL